MWLGFLECCTCCRTHEVTGVVAYALGCVVVEQHRATTLTHSLAQRGCHALAVLLAHDQAVDDHIDGVGLVAVKLKACGELTYLAIDARIDIALARHSLEELAVVTLTALDYRGKEGHPATLKGVNHKVDNLLIAIAHHGFARMWRVGTRRTRIQ